MQLPRRIRSPSSLVQIADAHDLKCVKSQLFSIEIVIEIEKGKK
jgi:hypothetical protein